MAAMLGQTPASLTGGVLTAPRRVPGVVVPVVPGCLAPLLAPVKQLAPLLHTHQALHVTRTAMLDAPVMSTSFASMMDDEGEDSEQEVVHVAAAQQDESLRVENLNLSPETVAAMHKRGIAALFPIQKSVFEPIREGRDLIGRAKTGSGKTLAFALPVVEAILKENREGVAKSKRGRAPRCIVLAPTRELANQVAREFETVCPSLSVVSVYGGVPLGGQIRDLSKGCDVVVGTPGRVQDLIERESLNLNSVQFAILDEADQMLDMGFEEDMEKILGFVPEKRQTLLFSATLPKWVNKVARRFQTNPLLVDLVGEENTGRLADTIRLQVMQVERSQKLNACSDVISIHATAGKAMVFVNTKAMADELCDGLGAIYPTAALHGDISQAMRDRALQQFRDGHVMVLVATDVAARGLDIPNVDVIVHYDVPQDNEAFLHRSGRTGRAGKTGTAVVLFSDREMRSLGTILHQTKVDNAELVGAPPPSELLQRTARSVLGQLDKVDTDVIEFFVPAAEKLLTSDNPARVMAAALAALGGFRKVPQPRSLLTYEEGVVTLRLLSAPGAGGVDGVRSLLLALQSICAKAKVKRDLQYSIGKVQMVEDRANRLSGAAFDLKAEDAQYLLGHQNFMAAAAKMGYQLEQPAMLPLNVREMMGQGERGGRFGRDSGRAGPSRGYGSDRDRGSRSGGGGDRYGDRRGGSSSGSSRSGPPAGRSAGGSWEKARAPASRSGGYSNRRSDASDSFFDSSSTDDSYFAPARPAGTRSKPAPRQSTFTNPNDGQWAQW